MLSERVFRHKKITECMRFQLFEISSGKSRERKEISGCQAWKMREREEWGVTV